MFVNLAIDGIRSASLRSVDEDGVELVSVSALSGEIEITCRTDDGYAALSIYFNGLRCAEGIPIAELLLNRRELLTLARALQTAAEVVGDNDPRAEGSDVA